MIYPYICSVKDCGKEFEIIKPYQDCQNPEHCPACGADAKRVFMPWHVSSTASDWGKPEYNPALGAWTKDGKHRKELAKQKGLVEIGNDFGSGEKMHKHFDSERETKRRRSWDKV